MDWADQVELDVMLDLRRIRVLCEVARHGSFSAAAGALGFSFKMPNDPDGQSLAHRPLPTLFPTTPEAGKPDWLTQFMRTATAPDGPDGGKAGIGDCYYPTLLTNTSPLPASTCSMPKTVEGEIGD